jgi:hypothetical protein
MTEYDLKRITVLRRLAQNERLTRSDAVDLIARWEREAKGRGAQRDPSGALARNWVAHERSSDATTTNMSAVGDDGQVFGG